MLKSKEKKELPAEGATYTLIVSFCLSDVAFPPSVTHVKHVIHKAVHCVRCVLLLNKKNQENQNRLTQFKLLVRLMLMYNRVLIIQQYFSFLFLRNEN